MKKIFLTSILLSFLTICTAQNKVKKINVKDYGILANTKENLTAKVNQLIEGLGNESVQITFPKGRYDFFPDANYYRTYYESNTYDADTRKLAILIKNKKNITIDAQQSDFVYHGHIQPFTLDNAENITIKNINIDWDVPLTSESEIIEADENHILMKIDITQSPYKIHEKGLTFVGEGAKENWALSEGSWLIEFDKNHIIPANTGDNGCVKGDLKNVIYSEIKPGLVLMKGKFTKTPAVGNFLILRHGTRDHAGMFLFHSKNTKLENINVYHTSGLGILSQYCENIEMRKVNMIPNPKKNRYLSGHDDGLHFMGCKGEIIIDNCDAQGLMDDPINIHGTYVPVMEKIDDYALKCNFGQNMSHGLLWAVVGDKVGFIQKKEMNTMSYGIVSSFEPLDVDHFIIRFKEKIPTDIDANFVLENLSWTPNATITNCFVGSNRARGYLISTPGKVVIANNVFETSGSAILIAGDANYWYESGAVKDITIKNNEFRFPCNSSYYQFCEAIISIYPEIPAPNAMQPFHKNIKIENNSFNPSDYPILYAVSVDGLSFKNNTIKRSFAFTPWYPEKYNFRIEACKNVEISGNKIGKDVLGKNILLKGMQPTELNLKNTELSVEIAKPN
ncbi:hypothetical protein BD847_0314 [Flavobacterium cutihirudinis]|uniref:Parallel beta helix pectate lyase-like protein n=1 Tax=Flavobacterium cutihirudinis TaxID=1265740 RepID=A0A3D9FZJ8_9FLAO|nr:alpha-1,3-galactosidase B [Flavobacterium cutihirudinis]RED26396.1 hypothetical protein BD847_0314 [Flavobacterium cutihirudinis]